MKRIAIQSTAATATRQNHENIEGKFFAIVALAWVVLTFAFNVAHHALAQAKAPTDTHVMGQQVATRR
jgi:hypothetical protein